MKNKLTLVNSAQSKIHNEASRGCEQRIFMDLKLEAHRFINPFSPKGFMWWELFDRSLR
ncbi:MAG: hypothetical protein ACKVI9_02415 [Gammaproteobacteria bacterium]